MSALRACPAVAWRRRVIALTALVCLVALSRDAGAQGRGGGAARPAAAPAADVRSRLVQGNVWLINAGVVNVAAQIGPDGVFVVDTGTEAMGEKILAEIKRLAGDKPIRYIVNTHAPRRSHRWQRGRSRRRASRSSPATSRRRPARKRRMPRRSSPTRTRSCGWPRAKAASRRRRLRRCRPTRSSSARYDMFFNGEAVQMLHQPNAHTDGDIMVYFRKSDVLVTGDVYINTTFPVINLQQGGSLNGIIAALNRIVEITVPKDKQEGGTYVIPGHGRLADEADVVEYLDLVTIIRDRLKDAIDKRHDAGAGEGGEARSRLRGPLRRDAGLLDDGCVSRGGVQEPQYAAGGDVESRERLSGKVERMRQRTRTDRGRWPSAVRDGAPPSPRSAAAALPHRRRHRLPRRRRRSISPATGCRSSTRTGDGGW